MSSFYLYDFRKKSGNSLLKSELSDYSIDELTDYFKKNIDIFNKVTIKMRSEKLNEINKSKNE